MSGSCSGPQAFNPLCHAVTGLVGHVVTSVSVSVTKSTTSSVLSAIASWIASGASWVLERFAEAVQSTTSVDLTARWFTSHEAVMASLAAVMVLPLLMGALIQAIVRGSPELAVRAAFVNLPLALLLTGVAVQLAALGVAVTDQLCAMLWRGAGGSVRGAVDHLAQQLARNADGSGVPTAVIVIVSVLVMVGAVMLWLELLVRAAAIYATVLFLPLALASLVWPAVSHVARRMVTTLVGVVLSKFVIVAILTLAIGAVDQGSAASGGLPAELSGAALLLLTGFAPFVMIRLVGLADGALQLEGARASVHHGAMAVARTGVKAASWAASGLPLPEMFAGTAMNGAFEAPGATPFGAGDASLQASSNGWGRGGGGPSKATPGVERGAANHGSSPANGSSGGAAPPAREVPDWEGDPRSERAYSRHGGPIDAHPRSAADRGGGESTAGPAVTQPLPVLGASGSAARRLGGPPVYGVSWTEGQPEEDSGLPATARPEHHVIDRDERGPVIRWRPPTGPDDDLFGPGGRPPPGPAAAGDEEASR